MVEHKEFRFAAAQFDNSDFFSAHASFKELWIDTSPNEKDFLLGFVQLSVGMFHLVSGNLKGAVSQLRKSVEKLEKFNPEFFLRSTFFILFQSLKILFLKEKFSKK